jgi:hypothetical protein
MISSLEKKCVIPSPLLCGLYHPLSYRQTFAQKNEEVKNPKNSNIK